MGLQMSDTPASLQTLSGPRGIGGWGDGEGVRQHSPSSPVSLLLLDLHPHRRFALSTSRGNRPDRQSQPWLVWWRSSVKNK